MTITDKEAKWVEDQRKKVVDAIIEITTIVAKENLLPDEGRVYDVDMDLGTSGNQISIRIWKEGICIAKHETYCISAVFDDRGFIRFNKERSANQLKKLMRDLSQIKALAVKYVR